LQVADCQRLPLDDEGKGGENGRDTGACATTIHQRGKARNCRVCVYGAYFTFWRSFASKSAGPTADMNIFLDSWTFPAITWGHRGFQCPPPYDIWHFSFFLSSFFKFLLTRKLRESDEDSCISLLDQVGFLGSGAKPSVSEMRSSHWPQCCDGSQGAMPGILRRLCLSGGAGRYVAAI
jgi:hypothetical protein